MKEITILSGKGGTGKTTITAALASLNTNIVLCDNDVDASNMHLLTNPVIREQHIYKGAWNATINTEKCTSCGLCKNHCRFDAIYSTPENQFYIKSCKCEGCKLCERICPENAIHLSQSENNTWYVAETNTGPLIYAEMGPGEENSGKLVTHIRNTAKKYAKKIDAGYILNDGPPGIGCSTIASLTGADAVILVIEPTKSGFHDVKRLIELVNTFSIPQYAIINKYDLNLHITQEITNYLNKYNIPLIGKIPFSNLMVESMILGKSIIEYKPGSSISRALKSAWNSIKNTLKENRQKARIEYND